jgi:DNA polymerase-3 subunit gamma/tau
MPHQSLYRRYRPQRFSEVRGQEHLVKALQQAVAADRVGHAYLFSGPRGTGKTSTARILAKALNCVSVTDGEPCGVCESCVAIEAGRSFDLQELDAASNRGIAEMKSLLETIALGTPGRTKVYILDEVHMLTKEASAALLKTLEEPPAHVVFVLATTDPQKVLPTIRSRTQHFELRLLPSDTLHDLVEDVAADAGIEVTPEQVEYALRKGGGSARDTLSVLDQLAAAGSAPEPIEALEQVVEGLVMSDAGMALAGVQAAVSEGREPRVLGEQLLDELRDAFLVSQKVELPHRTEAATQRARDLGERWGARSLTHALELIGEALIEMRQAADPRIPLEVALLRLARPESDDSLDAIFQRLDRLERGLPAGAPSTVGSAPSAPNARAAPDEAATDDDAAAPASRPAAGRPADSARQVLAERQAPVGEARATGARERSALGAHRQPAQPVSKPEPEAIPDPEPTTPELPPAATAPSGDLPSRDEITLAWGDTIRPALSQRVRSRWAGRFLDVTAEGAIYALPNAITCDRCEEGRSEVEAALAAHFGRSVPVRLVVDDQSSPPSDALDPAAMRHGAGESDAEADIEAIGPVHELADAGDALDGVARLSEAFPGAELVEEAQDPDRERSGR